MQVGFLRSSSCFVTLTGEHTDLQDYRRQYDGLFEQRTVGIQQLVGGQ